MLGELGKIDDWFGSWITPVALFLISVVLAILARIFLAARLRQAFESPQDHLEEFRIVLRSIPAWIILAGISAAAQSSPLSAKEISLVHRGVITAFFVSATFALSELAAVAVRRYSILFRSRAKTTGITENLARAAVLLLGGLLILSNLGVSITPILGALGVGSLAVALALQDTLTNVFAGIHIVASRMVSVGDYVKLETGQEGFVTDVGWRVTRLRDLAGNEILLSNSKLSNSTLVNYHQPFPETAVGVEFRLSPKADLAKVEQIIEELGRQVQLEAKGAVPDFQPSALFGGFDGASVKVTVGLKARSFPERGPLVHAFVKQLHARLQKEGIDLYPAEQVLRVAR